MSDKTIKEAWDTLTKAMAKDSDWAWSVHCNIAMSISDTIDCSHKDANKAAASVMLHIFHYDVSGYAHYCDIMHAGNVNLNSPKLFSLEQSEDQWYNEHATEECPTESENPKVVTEAEVGLNSVPTNITFVDSITQMYHSLIDKGDYVVSCDTGMMYKNITGLNRDRHDWELVPPEDEEGIRVRAGLGVTMVTGESINRGQPEVDDKSDPNCTDTRRNRNSKTPELAAERDSQSATPTPPYAAKDIVTPILNPQPPHTNQQTNSRDR